MNMIVPEFVLFSVYAVVNAYLPLFLRTIGYGATQIGFLYAVFNGTAVIAPLFIAPALARRGWFASALLVLGAVLALVPVPLIYARHFALTALCMGVYAVAYRMVIPVSDALITQTLDTRRERYGAIRVWGSIGFVAAALFMQRKVHAESATRLTMMLWLSLPALAFTLSMLVRNALCDRRPHTATPAEPAQPASVPTEAAGNTASTLSVLRSFGAGFYLVMFVIFMEYFGMIPANQYISMYAEEELHVRGAGVLWALSAAIEIPFMFASGLFVRRFGSRRLIIVSTLSVTVRNLLYAFVPGFAGCIAGQLLHSLSYGLFFPSCVAFCSESASRANPDGCSRAALLAMSIQNAVYCLASVIGAPVGGIIIDSMGYRALFLFFAAFPLAAVTVYALAQRLLRCGA